MSRNDSVTPTTPNSLDALYERFDAIANGRNKHGDSRAAHAAIVDRLAANRGGAESAGWTSLALERDGGMGRLRLFGLAPNATTRTIVPDAARAID